jgi:uncharacterized protein
MLEHVYCIPVDENGCQLLFAPLLNTAALMNDRAAELLRRAMHNGEPLQVDSSLGRVAAELSANCSPPPLPTGPANPPFLGLILTRECNMGCLYCDFASGDGGEIMSEELVSQAITGWAEWVKNVGGDLLDLHFFGGEPFTQPELVEIAIHRTRLLAQKYDMSVHVEACTNGLLNARILAFVRDHFDAIVLSLDGQEIDHDRQRPLRTGKGSFNGVWHTAEELAESRVNLCIRCCVSHANVGRMTDSTRWLCQTLQPESITFEAMKPSSQTQASGLKPPDPLQFTKGFINAWRIAKELGVACVYSALYNQPHRTFCPVGSDTFIIAADRSVRSCYLRRRDWEACGINMRIGNVKVDGTLQIDPLAIQRLRKEVADRPRCARCFCRWSCAGGCLVTETPPRHRLEFTDFCQQTRLIQACVLLDQLGQTDFTDRLLKDEGAVARFWNIADDRLDGMHYG